MLNFLYLDEDSSIVQYPAIAALGDYPAHHFLCKMCSGCCIVELHIRLTECRVKPDRVSFLKRMAARRVRTQLEV